MTRCDYHLHTVFCDGKNTPEEMVRAAIRLGMETLGFSAHSHTWFDESYCLPKEKIPAYRAEIARLKETYADRIRILCGIEQDLYSDAPADAYDYRIGSVHYFRLGEEFFPVDEGNEKHRRAAQKYFGGDLYALAEEYYRSVALLPERTNCDIIGHFDVITKYYEREPALDVTHPRYRAAWKSAVDILAQSGLPFEINTGAISRGVRKTPYPSEEILRYLAEKRIPVILSSDAHAAENIMFGFSEISALAQRLGLRVVTLEQ